RASWRCSKRRGAKRRKSLRSPTTCFCRRARPSGSRSSGGKPEPLPRGRDHDVGRALDAQAACVETEMVVLHGAPVATPVALHVLLALSVPLFDLVMRRRRIEPAMSDG